MNVPAPIRTAVLALALLFPGIAITGSWISSEVGCTPHEAKSATKDALTIAQIACIMASPFFDSSADVMKACGILDEAKPAVDALLSQKRASRGWCGPGDAGEKDAK